MDKNTQNWKEFTLGNPQEEPPRRVDKKHRRRKRVRFALVFLLVLAIVAAAILWDRGTFDGLRRSVLYYRAEKDETGCAQLYTYPSDKTSCFLSLGGSLVNASQNQLQLIDESNDVLYSASVQFLKPAVGARGGLGLVYDVGGTGVYVLNSKGLRWQKTMEGEVLIAALSDGGYTAVVYNNSGYKAGVSVFDSEGREVFAFLSADRFLLHAAVSHDGKSVAIISLGQDDGVFASYMTIYRLSSTEPAAECIMENNMIYQLGTVGNTFCAVGDESLFFVDGNGTIRGTYHYGDEYLRRCSLTGNGYAALLLGHYKTGTDTKLLIIDPNGDEQAVTALDSEVLNLSAAGRYVAVLYSDSMTIFDKALTQQAALTDSSEGRAVLMRDDGSAVIAGAARASLYLP